jgi:membrane protease YdiL (CAAX protease family)
MLGVSDLPEIILKGISAGVPPWLPWSKLAVPAMLGGLCLCLRATRPLWRFAFVLLVFQVALRASSWVLGAPWWQGLFGGRKAAFELAYLRAYIPDLGVAAAVVVALWAVKRRRADFFLAVGDLDAPIQPVPWLGIREGGSWRVFGSIFAVVAGLGVLIPTALSVHISPGDVGRAAPLLPAAVAFAAINALTEEIYFRASILATLQGVLGTGHALLLNAVFFGLAHYLYGSPSGFVGFLMTGFLAFLLGKSMLETKGLAWPWFIHFVPDVVIFASYCLLWVQP